MIGIDSVVWLAAYNLTSKSSFCNRAQSRECHCGPKMNPAR